MSPLTRETLVDALLELRRETALLRDSCRRVGNERNAAMATVRLAEIDRRLQRLAAPSRHRWRWFLLLAFVAIGLVLLLR
jgi:hypothetical protein